jgi:hypothetical protein
LARFLFQAHGPHKAAARRCRGVESPARLTSVRVVTHGEHLTSWRVPREVVQCRS